MLMPIYIIDINVLLSTRSSVTSVDYADWTQPSCVCSCVRGGTIVDPISIHTQAAVTVCSHRMPQRVPVSQM